MRKVEEPWPHALLAPPNAHELVASRQSGWESSAPATKKSAATITVSFEEAVENLLRVKDLRGKLGRNDGETND